MSLLDIELLSFWSALVGYSVATAIALWALVFGKRPERTLMGLILLAFLLHSCAIGARWIRIDHLPVGNTFEMLSANIWGLMAAVTIGYWRLPRMRAFAAIVLPVVMIMMAWMLLLQRADSSLPPTYHTVWLFIHIGFIKLFLGCAFIALGIAGIILLRAAGVGTARLARMPEDEALDRTAYRCMGLALIFDTLGIMAGAIWAQDAWGRYWSWDHLEIWSLLTWLSIGLTLHVRKPFNTSPRTNALLVVGTWLVAFFTFFGIPFVSTALHKGMI
ncbi:cytochrome c biogenesis protein CcsA [Dechloromonas sp. A34]|uniref:cytochrome c biogenesis protein CcsA n=1 Tax=Dechloromonas sp. A34 TaxID=447588 RepID=UPI002248CA5A|nr:cytochrome c biogenesis protein CcsA [Dechloromonas sp. A34]